LNAAYIPTILFSSCSYNQQLIHDYDNFRRNNTNQKIIESFYKFLDTAYNTYKNMPIPNLAAFILESNTVSLKLRSFVFEDGKGINLRKYKPTDILSLAADSLKDFSIIKDYGGCTIYINLLKIHHIFNVVY